MFTMAGFRDDYVVIGAADVTKLGTGGIARCYLVRWSTGELAWASRTQVCWPSQVRVCAGPADLIQLSDEDARR